MKGLFIAEVLGCLVSPHSIKPHAPNVPTAFEDTPTNTRTAPPETRENPSGPTCATKPSSSAPAPPAPPNSLKHRPTNPIPDLPPKADGSARDSVLRCYPRPRSLMGRHSTPKYWAIIPTRKTFLLGSWWARTMTRTSSPLNVRGVGSGIRVILRRRGRESRVQRCRKEAMSAAEGHLLDCRMILARQSYRVAAVSLNATFNAGSPAISTSHSISRSINRNSDAES